MNTYALTDCMALLIETDEGLKNLAAFTKRLPQFNAEVSIVDANHGCTNVQFMVGTTRFSFEGGRLYLHVTPNHWWDVTSQMQS